MLMVKNLQRDQNYLIINKIIDNISNFLKAVAKATAY